LRAASTASRDMPRGTLPQYSLFLASATTARTWQQRAVGGGGQGDARRAQNIDEQSAGQTQLIACSYMQKETMQPLLSLHKSKGICCPLTTPTHSI
jgi:hypothetical protein